MNNSVFDVVIKAWDFLQIEFASGINMLFLNISVFDMVNRYTSGSIDKVNESTSDGKGRALDNIFVERFFRTLKYENIYLNEYETPKSLRRGLNQYIKFYNEQRLHGSLGYRRPVDFYHQDLAQLAS
ncbi:Ribonuclease H-like domain [Syntrophomonas zehnderi OL-4]|uniref:Ribonuclease H-like domain n=1 Tax=Syntrophomonas zehnderi OL-4 TaxID=690567 RepID=A0A0E4C9F1_9FIRM|nr:integrase core domain-containing protein [Syntrophomonas zehnderi]CFX97478.1 Ribonuclease H-like domain [Syntrophomonas zehnderi OL-4]